MIWYENDHIFTFIFTMLSVESVSLSSAFQQKFLGFYFYNVCAVIWFVLTAYKP